MSTTTSPLGCGDSRLRTLAGATSPWQSLHWVLSGCGAGGGRPWQLPHTGWANSVPQAGTGTRAPGPLWQAVFAHLPSSKTGVCSRAVARPENTMSSAPRSLRWFASRQVSGSVWQYPQAASLSAPMRSGVAPWAVWVSGSVSWQVRQPSGPGLWQSSQLGASSPCPWHCSHSPMAPGRSVECAVRNDWPCSSFQPAACTPSGVLSPTFDGSPQPESPPDPTAIRP
jgi:hypothetical protein